MAEPTTIDPEVIGDALLLALHRTEGQVWAENLTPPRRVAAGRLILRGYAATASDGSLILTTAGHTKALEVAAQVEGSSPG